MVDKSMSLTFSVRNNPGRFALLLGSGVSTDAEIPTGWAVVKDLIRELAEVRDESIDTDPETWYEDKYGEEPAYDTLIEELAPSQEERQALLEGYFEPTPEERGRDEKTPTEAHESIAWLVDNDYIDIIVTTNFDRLLEQALSNRGITPVVISGPEDAKGAEPLTHQEAVILKVNGDYKETNLKNIASELEEYAPPMQSLIEQVFEEYGLIICGWSAQYDTALRKSLKECEKHRYSTYWAYYGSFEDTAESLVSYRNGFSIQIDGASPFFSELRERVQALEGAESGAPLTREIARERVKRYLTREERKIDLEDLLREESEAVYDRIFDESLFPLVNLPDDFSIDKRLESYEEATKTLAVAAATCAYWGGDTVNPGTQPIIKAIQKMGSTTYPDGRYNMNIKLLRRYPVSFVTYGVGVAAVEAENWDLIQELMVETNVRPHIQSSSPMNRPNRAVVEAVHPWRIGEYLENDGSVLRSRMKDQLEALLTEFFIDHQGYESSFEEFEAVADLLLLQAYNNRGWSIENLRPTYQTVRADSQANPLSHFERALDEQEDSWPPLQAGLFDSSPDLAKELISEMENPYY